MNITLIRSATLVVKYGERTFLVDPMLGDVGANPPIPMTDSNQRNPLTPLPANTADLLAPVDTIVLTHLHTDHFDPAAKEQLDKGLPVLGQPQQVEQIREAGFTDVTAVDPVVTIGDITITRTDGQHGTGDIGAAMAPVSGFVFSAPDEPTLYIAGDTIWCNDVAIAIERFDPDVIVVNGGGARFNVGDPITMTASDIAQTHSAAPNAALIVVHLDAIAHCVETRPVLNQQLIELGVRDLILIPDDGENHTFQGPSGVDA